MMLPSTHSWRRYLLYAATVLIFVALWVTQYSQTKLNPGAVYNIVRPKQREVPIFNVAVDAENGASKAVPEVNVRLWTANAPPGQPTTTSYASKSFSSTTDEASLEYTKAYTPAPTNDTDETFMREREKAYAERRRRVQEVCEKLGSTVAYKSLTRAPLLRLRWLTSHRFIMCFNAKVGTTTWTKYLLERSRPAVLKTAKSWHNAAKKILRPPFGRNSPKTLALMKKFGKVMIVRHPFSRIVSAYLDKMKGNEFKWLQNHIVQKYRAASSSSSSSASSSSSSASSSSASSSSSSESQLLHPTFEEFVRYLVAVTPAEDDVTTKYYQGSSNVHWTPFYANCAPCNIDYEVILSMDTINEDTRYVSERFGLGLEKGIWYNRARSNNSSEVTAAAYFKALPRNLTLALHQRYRIDFRMFGYSVTPFLADT